MTTLPVYLSFYFFHIRAFVYALFGRWYTPQAVPVRNLSGQVAIVTGANSGIGLSIATSLARQGATVYLACRNLSKGNEAVEFIVSQLNEGSKERVSCWHLDVGDLNNVRDFCSRWSLENGGTKISMLVHNAGIPEAPAGTKKTDEKGRDLVYVTNFLGSFLMTHLLETHLSSDARIVFTSSLGQFKVADVMLHPRPAQASQELKFKISTSYAYTKALQALFAHLLQRHFSASQDHRRTAHAFSPGLTSTAIFGKFASSWKTWFIDPQFALVKVVEQRLGLSADEGSKTGSWLAACGGEAGLEPGAYWEYMSRAISSVDLKRLTLGEEVFARKCREVWRAWESDAGVEWEVEI